MTLDEAQPDMPVLYVPMHADGDRNHKDCENGIISSKNDRFVFVMDELMTPTVRDAIQAEKMLLTIGKEREETKCQM